MKLYVIIIKNKMLLYQNNIRKVGESIKKYRNEWKYILTNGELSLLKSRISKVMELDSHTKEIRKSLSCFFTFLEVEDYIVKSPIRIIHKINTKILIKETY